MGLVGRRLQDHAACRLGPCGGRVGIRLKQAQFCAASARTGFRQQRQQRIGMISPVGMQLQKLSMIIDDREIIADAMCLHAEYIGKKTGLSRNVADQQVQPQT